MLQQTQVSRVLGKYGRFIAMFPGWKALSRAPLSRVLSAWNGMGYPRRALGLKRIAEIVVTKYDSVLPRDFDSLLSLPSVGPATAGSILAFAFGKPVAFIETNIRAVYIHFFFKGKKRVGDPEILRLVDETLDRRNPRKWYYALMDFGAALKKREPGLRTRAGAEKKQTPFRGSARELRAAILRQIGTSGRASAPGLGRMLSKKGDEVSMCLAGLEREGFIRKVGRVYAIRDY
jgi:A/G-specific adenine glycosylase